MFRCLVKLSVSQIKYERIHVKKKQWRCQNPTLDMGFQATPTGPCHYQNPSPSYNSSQPTKHDIREAELSRKNLVNYESLSHLPLEWIYNFVQGDRTAISCMIDLEYRHPCIKM